MKRMQKGYYIFIEDIIPKNFLALINPQNNKYQIWISGGRLH